jgi:electron transfer flavoprotein beta subunit
LPCHAFHDYLPPKAKKDEDAMAFSILVCIKAVPDLAPGGELTLADRWIDETAIDWCMNHYDAHALEAALAIRDATPDVTIDAISAGPDRVRDTIRRAMAMGADAGIHLAMETPGRLSPEAVAMAIADYARHKNHDLILTGAVSEDLMQGVTGPLIAAALDRPCAAAAVEIAPDTADRSLVATCEMEGGMAEIVRLRCPALVTVQTGQRIPRYPSLSNTLRSRRQTIERVVPDRNAGPASMVGTRQVAFPKRTSTCRVIDGTVIEKADTLLRLFNDNGWLK